MRPTIIITIGLLCSSTAAQDLVPAARAFIADHVPARDNADLRFAALLENATRIASSTVSHSLLQRTWALLPLLSKPEQALALVDDFLQQDSHGLSRENALAVRYQLLRNLGQFEAAAKVDYLKGFAKTLTVIGPFGDAGDFYYGVPFPPQVRFPQPDQRLKGRYGPVRTRQVVRDPTQRAVTLTRPGRAEVGCWYALHQVESQDLKSIVLEIGSSGSYEFFVNGRRLGGLNRHAKEAPYTAFYRAALRKGHNHVLIKTTDNRFASFALRYLDTKGGQAEGISEFAAAPEVKGHAMSAELDKGLPDETGGAQIAHPIDVLQKATRTAKGAPRATLLLATALLAGRQNLHTLVWDLLDDCDPSHLEPEQLLGLALAMRNAARMPPELRRSRARKLIQLAANKLDASHHSLGLAQVRLLQEADQKEKAIRKLQERVSEGTVGPEVFARLDTLLRSLRFTAETHTNLLAWQKAVPRDARPRLLQITERSTRGDRAGARELVDEALRLQPANIRLLQLAIVYAAEAGDKDRTAALLSRLYDGRLDSLDYLVQRAGSSRHLGSREETVALYEAVAKDERCSARQVLDAGDVLSQLGNEKTANVAWRRSLEMDQGQHMLRRRLNRLEGKVDYPEIAAFRINSDEVLKEFQIKPERERSASATLLLDQLIVQVFPDGSQVSETHTIRRINDQQGVDTRKNASATAGAEEVLRVRTIGTDGKSYVPNRVANEFSMPRLRPGCFVEEIYRNTSASPEPGPWRTTTFYFQSSDEPFVRSEFVVILPKERRGTFRMRNYDGKPETRSLEGGWTAYVFQRRNLPRLRTEALIPPIEELVPIVSFGEDNSTEPAARGLRARMLREAIQPNAVRAKARELTKGLDSDLARLRAIHDFVQDTIEDGGTSRDPAVVLALKKGPRFYLERALLKSAGIPLRDAVVEMMHRDQRREPPSQFLGTENYPIPAILVEPSNGGAFWLFADMPRHYPMGAIPAVRFGAGGRFATDGKPFTLPSQDPRGRVGQRVQATVELLKDGGARMKASVTLAGPLGYIYAERLRNERQNTRRIVAQRLLSGTFPGWRIESSEFPDFAKKGKPLALTSVLVRSGALRKAGGELLLPLPLAPGQLLSAFGGRGERKLPMRLSLVAGTEWEVVIVPGPNYEPSGELPDGVSVRRTGLEYDLDIRADGSTVRIRRSLLLLPGTIPASRFAQWRETLQKLDRAERSQLRFRLREKR